MISMEQQLKTFGVYFNDYYGGFSSDADGCARRKTVTKISIFIDLSPKKILVTNTDDVSEVCIHQM